jgi:hypothetical protein
MTDLQDDQTIQPPSLFSPEDPVGTLWIRSYQGEILGEILFGRIATQLSDPDRKRKMQVLSTLERRTKEAVVPALERAGISTEPDPETVSTAEALADGSASLAWLDLMASFEPITTQYAALYARIGELDPTEQATADLLVAHELALRDFGRQEIAGAGDDSLKAILALDHMQ